MAHAIATASFSGAAPASSLPHRRNTAGFFFKQRPPVECSGPDLLAAAKLTVDKYVRSGMVVGLGSGRASGLAIQYLGHRLRDGSLKDVVGVPTSVSSASKAAMAGIPLDNYQENLQIDFVFDDADLIDKRTLTAVIGRRKLDGGESIIQEKSIIKRASGLAYIVTDNQYTGELGGSIPVLITSGNWLETAEQIDDLFLGDAELCKISYSWFVAKVWRRSPSGGAGPLGGDFPLVTKEGHHVLDVIFTSPILDLGQVAESLDQVDGVVDHGIICGIPCTVIIASKEGLEVVDNMSKNQTTDSL
ncbi:probable ribose-5-phosphate isomerase 4, chloroplastic isoform X1 [Zingiber officinale]|uniref:probable ribose-5-phosphate isomerase 4, chloroplastic isoform X1 n=1 Tax=Zingiber officinale TaxID=94328 RepID=UPI001C4D6946|nr:probable ribose-5-phosphate isomerase 4, chloroplastic isoform X1 [Zingiber officinale]XP_042465449.1 probable ribose-5-phosphate isomerase 4, chloroplastic isoform X1 [Zingiber officinale]XP_042465450.1 probable ribose-5-phosphate isomerase 4, chloroplastic isoform X1 [Zingiber officinale]XP_042465451.1 probable ribose-5-phosphate isomerase 4, chloroplastic isoform X1 [Zingiber officinale]